MLIQFTVVTMEIVRITPATALHLGHGSDFSHQSAPPVGPTSQISSSAIFLLPTLKRAG
jgi:hypothetical protein